MFLVGNGLVALAERSVASSLAAVVCAAMPLFAAGLSVLVGERPSSRQWIGLFLGFAGVAVMSLGELRATPGAALLLVCAPLGWATGSLAAKRLPQVSWLVAPTKYSEHPEAPPAYGESFTARILDALSK